MADEFTEFEFETETDELADRAFAELEEEVPGWIPNAANLDTRLILKFADMCSVVAQVANVPPATIFRFFGEKLIGEIPTDPTPARATTTWTFTAPAPANGYRIPLHHPVAIDGQGFLVPEEVAVAESETTASIELIAIEAGAAGSGLAGDEIELVELLDFVAEDGIVLDEPTSGGTDGQTPEEYQDQLARTLRTLSLSPIVASDYNDLATKIPTVFRTLVLDLYKPGPPWDPDPENTDTPGAVTLVPITEAGEAVDTATRNALDDLMQSRRQMGFLIYVIAPTYTTIDVTFTATIYPGYDANEVGARAEAAVAEWLSPSMWGQPRFGDRGVWYDDPLVRYRNLVAVLENVEGLRDVTAQTINTLANTDVALTGPGALPQPGTITGTITS